MYEWNDSIQEIYLATKLNPAISYNEFTLLNTDFLPKCLIKQRQRFSQLRFEEKGSKSQRLADLYS